MKLRLVLPLIVASVSIAEAAPDASCWFGTPTGTIRHWPQSVSIPVLVSESASDGVQLANYDPSLVERVVRVVIQRWNEDTGTTIRLFWAGRSTAPTAVYPFSIIVKGSANCDTAIARGTCIPESDGLCHTGFVSLSIGERAGNVCTGTQWAPGMQDNPEHFTNLMTHEVGHALGRNDAPTGSACGDAHNTVMTDSLFDQDITDFDRTDHQAVYGARAATNVLQHRTFNSRIGGWGNIVTDGANNYDVAPGPGASFNVTPIPVTLVQLGNPSQILQRGFTVGQSWLADVALAPVLGVPHQPISTSFAPSTEGFMAYVLDTGGSPARKICWRRRQSNFSSWGPEVCSTACYPDRNAVSTTYDPVGGRFIMAHECLVNSAEGILVTVLPTYGCSGMSCQGSTTFINERVVETPAIACSDQTSPLYANCRIAYTRRNDYDQPISWHQFGLVPPSPPVAVFGKRVDTTITSEHAPAIAWFNGTYYFYMAVNHEGRAIDLYSQWGTDWYQDAQLNSSGWVSRPFLSTASSCASCIKTLNVFWLKYTEPPLVGGP